LAARFTVFFLENIHLAGGKYCAKFIGGDVSKAITFEGASILFIKPHIAMSPFGLDVYFCHALATMEKIKTSLQNCSDKHLIKIALPIWIAMVPSHFVNAGG
jgi:hypothetical protein